MRVKPIYQEHPDPELNGNPLTEAIQVILCSDKVRALINYTPEFVEDFHTQPRFYQNMNIRRLSEVFVAPQITPLLYDKFMEFILDGYRFRNPFSKTMTKFLHELSERDLLIHDEEDNSGNVKANTKAGTKEKPALMHKIIPPGMTTAPGSIVSGPSGSGKTSIIRAVLGLIPQVITHSGYKEHESFQQDQIVWVSFDAPTTPSTKALCLNFMKSVDEALGIERYYPEYFPRTKNLSVDQFISAVQAIAANHYIGLVHLDEMQFFLNYSETKDAPNLQTLEAMFNKLGIPMVISTTDKGLPVINMNEQTKRRILSEQHFKLGLLKPKSKEFARFIEALFLPEVWGETDTLINQPEFIQKFHYHSAGLPAVMTRLARLHLFYAVQSGRSAFDTDLLKSVFESQFQYMEDSLAALRIGDLDSYEQKAFRNKDGSIAWCLEDWDENNQAGEPEDESPESDINNENNATDATLLSSHTGGR
ncbi:AAA family ATPase [uncultured Neptuniibacter sp.]|uniref:AAA family ATPase n=1 Tax=uncultured Neptuniibacter sp. TaxID=502143 RepID=UPI002633B908|nr:AAA family ATPase [uncultured Neptuniibacter sp.]